MATKKPKTVLYRRRREGKTNYKQRLKLLFSRKLKLSVRFTNQKIISQLIKFESQADKVILGIDSTALRKLGWNYSLNSMPAAYLTGLLLGKEALKKDINEAIFDIGAKRLIKGGKLSSFLKGVIDSGFVVPYGDESIFPTEERIKGEHIKNYAETLKENKEAYDKIFSKYLKNKVQPEKIVVDFEKIKQELGSKE